jgi:hypothetical protein
LKKEHLQSSDPFPPQHFGLMLRLHDFRLLSLESGAWKCGAGAPIAYVAAESVMLPAYH